MAQSFTFPGNHVHVFIPGFLIQPRHLQQTCIPLDGGNGGLEFVGYAADKVLLQIGCAAQVIRHAVEGAEQFPQFTRLIIGQANREIPLGQPLGGSRHLGYRFGKSLGRQKSQQGKHKGEGSACHSESKPRACENIHMHIRANAHHAVLQQYIGHRHVREVLRNG